MATIRVNYFPASLVAGIWGHTNVTLTDDAGHSLTYGFGPIERDGNISLSRNLNTQVDGVVSDETPTTQGALDAGLAFRAATIEITQGQFDAVMEYVAQKWVSNDKYGYQNFCWDFTQGALRAADPNLDLAPIMDGLPTSTGMLAWGMRQNQFVEDPNYNPAWELGLQSLETLVVLDQVSDELLADLAKLPPSSFGADLDAADLLFGSAGDDTLGGGVGTDTLTLTIETAGAGWVTDLPDSSDPADYAAWLKEQGLEQSEGGTFTLSDGKATTVVNLAADPSVINRGQSPISRLTD